MKQSQAFFFVSADDFSLDSMVHGVDGGPQGQDEKALCVSHPEQGCFCFSHASRGGNQQVRVLVVLAENLQIVPFGLAVLLLPAVKQVLHILLQKVMGIFTGNPRAGTVVAPVEQAFY